MGRLVFIPLPLFVQVLARPFGFWFCGVSACLFLMRYWRFLYLYNSGNEKEPGVGLSNEKYGVKYLVGLPKR